MDIRIMNWLKKIAQINEGNERPIFNFVRAACEALTPQPTVRVAGGWVRDQLLGISSKDVDLTIDIMTGVEFADHLKKFASTDIRYRDQHVVGTIKTTEERPEQIKNLQVSFLKIFGEEIEILNLRGVEFYEKGNRNPTVINLPELQNISTTQGIPAFLRSKAPHLMEALSKLPPEQHNDPLRVIEVLDAHRRDLTINAMYYNINNQSIEDMTGNGLNDIKNTNLNTPLDPVKTFQDDPLRLLRVLRFYSRYANSQIDPRVTEAMNDEDVQHQITRKIVNSSETQGIVTERTSEEFRKIMQGSQPEKALGIMYKTGLLSKMLNLPPDYEPLNMDQRNRHHQLTVIDHTLEVLKNVNSLSKEFGLSNDQRMMLNIAAVFHDLGKLDPRSHKNKDDGSRGYSGDPNDPYSVPHEIASGNVWTSFAIALGMTKDESRVIHDLVSSHMRPHSHIEGNEGIVNDKQLRKYIRKNPSWVFQYIHAMADAMSKTKDPDVSRTEPYRHNLERLRQLAPSADEFGNMPPANDILNGKDIMNIVGLPPKPPEGMPGYIELVKERIRDEQDMNPELTREDAITLVEAMIQRGELDAYRI